MKAIVHAAHPHAGSIAADRPEFAGTTSAFAALIRRADFEARDILVRTLAPVTGPNAWVSPADVPMVMLFGLAAASGRHLLALWRNGTSRRRRQATGVERARRSATETDETPLTAARCRPETAGVDHP